MEKPRRRVAAMAGTMRKAAIAAVGNFGAPRTWMVMKVSISPPMSTPI